MLACNACCSIEDLLCRCWHKVVEYTRESLGLLGLPAVDQLVSKENDRSLVISSISCLHDATAMPLKRSIAEPAGSTPQNNDLSVSTLLND